MRSIGKKNIALVKKITREEMKKIIAPFHSVIGSPDYSSIEDTVIDKLPVELWNIWECADSEIRRIINDEIAQPV